MDRFIVGTGRCGSTLLSRMLAECPAVLSLFEFFNGLDAGLRFDDERVAGAEYAEFIACEQPFVTAVLRRGYEVSEIVYPFGSGRYRPDEPLPWILVTLLPRLTDDPDALFEEVLAFASSLPTASRVVHTRRVFDWLTARLGKRVWIERSGSSIDYLGALARAFPDARFLHLHRDGREVALSMREHHAYRLPISLLYDTPLDDGSRLADLGPIDLHAEPTDADPISRVLASRPPAHHFGAYWNDQIQRGFEALPRLDAGRALDVRFEDLVAKPNEVLDEIRAFFALPGDAEWIARGAGLVHGIPPTRFDALPEAEQRALHDACLPGLRLLGRA